MGWLIYVFAVLVLSTLIGMHLGRFREAYTEMTGMMAGMTMGMMNGFVLGFAMCCAFLTFFRLSNTVSMFWGNVAGIALGLLLGAYFGRAGGLMGIMDGGMGGVMGGSMGAMLAAMLAFPEQLLLWTAIPLTLVYIVSMAALVVLIERSAPGHAALHRLAPYFTRAIAEEAEEAAQQSGSTSPAQMDDYYEFLGLPRNATNEAINDAYLATLAASDGPGARRADRALAILTDPAKRRLYDSRLAPSDRADCCPPARKPKVVASASVAASRAVPSATVSTAERRRQSATFIVTPSILPSRPPRNARRKPGESAVATRTTRTRPVRKNSVGWHGPGVVGIAILILIGVLASWWIGSALSGDEQHPVANGSMGMNAGEVAKTDSGMELPADFVSRLKTQAVQAPLASDGKQTLDLTIYGDTMSYMPANVKVKHGIPVRLNVNIGAGRDPG